MGLIPWPTKGGEAWDLLYLGGRIFPGLATVKITGGQKIDVKDAPGSDGEATTQQGEKAKIVTITLRMWTEEQWNEYEEAHEIIEPILGKRVPVDLATAAADFRNVGFVLIEDVEGPNWHADKQWMEFVYKCRQHKPPPKKSATKKNDASASTVTGSTRVFPTDGSGIGGKSKVLVAADEDGYVVYTKTKKSVQQGYAAAQSLTPNTTTGSV